MNLHRLVLATSALVLAVGAIGCAASQITTPRSRVAKDLGCSTEETRVTKVASLPGEAAARWQVDGCGKTAIYVCTTPVRDCWREGSVRPETAGAPSAP